MRMSCVEDQHPAVQSFYGTNGVEKPDQFIAVVTCPECGRTGTATWEEKNNTDDAADTATVPTNISNGFRAGSESEIYCKDCGVEAITGPNSK
jgi:hypothetical protein